MYLRKTFKREVAVGILLAFGYVVYGGDVEMVKVLVWPVFSFAGLAFGLDWHGKNSNNSDGSTASLGMR